MKGNVIDMAVGVIIGGAFWQNRLVAGGGCHHASRRAAGGRGELHRPEVGAEACRGAGRGGGGGGPWR